MEPEFSRKECPMAVDVAAPEIRGFGGPASLSESEGRRRGSIRGDAVAAVACRENSPPASVRWSACRPLSALNSGGIRLGSGRLDAAMGEPLLSSVCQERWTATEISLRRR